MKTIDTEKTESTHVFRTGRIICFDWVCGALDDASIPYQCREETSGGLQFAMPAAPSTAPVTGS